MSILNDPFNLASAQKVRVSEDWTQTWASHPAGRVAFGHQADHTVAHAGRVDSLDRRSSAPAAAAPVAGKLALLAFALFGRAVPPAHLLRKVHDSSEFRTTANSNRIFKTRSPEYICAGDARTG